MPSSCPTSEDLKALLSDGLAEGQEASLMEHLEGCGVCRQRLEAMTETLELRLKQARLAEKMQGTSHLHEVMAKLKASDRAMPAGATDDPLLSSGTRLRYIGDYEILDEVGRGGMGVVYRARQVSLQREVALKVILSGQLASEQEVRRFHVEAEAAAKLDHPNLVSIYEIGEHEGRHYFSMRLVDGGNLAEGIAQGRFRASQRQEFSVIARLMATVAEAVHYAHQRGILHRDLKPSNILLDSLGQPHLTDFGLAKIQEQDSSLTRSLAVMGTPNYMAPELAAGQARQVTTAADIFSLGAILYELLTGRPPFEAEMAAATLQRVITVEPTSPQARNPAVPRDLATICLKCLEKEPSRRYPTARELAEDLGRWQRDEPILARPVSHSEKFWRWCRRKPALAATSAALLVVFALGLAGVLWQWQRAMKLAVSERRQWQQTEALFTRLELQRAEDMFAAGDAPTALACLGHVLRREPTNQLVAARIMSALTFRSFALPVFEPLRHDRLVKSASFSPDGQRIVTASEDKTARVWDARTGRLICTVRHEGKVNAAEFSPDGRWLATASWDRSARVWDTQTGKPRRAPFQHDDMVLMARFSPDGQWLATASYDQKARLWNIQTGELRCPPLLHRGQVRSVQFSPDGLRLVTGSEDHSAQVWDVRTGQPLLATRLRHQHVVRCAEFSPDGQRVATASEDHTARVWDANTGQPITPPLQHAGPVTRIQFSPEGTRLLTASADRTARIWDAQTGQLLITPLQHNGEVHTAEFSPDGLRVVTASWDKSARVWDALTGQPLLEPFSHEQSVSAARFSPDGLRVVTASADATSLVWDVRVARALPVSLEHAGQVFGAEFDVDGQRALTASSDSRAQVWNVRTGQLLATLKPRDWVRAAHFSPNGQRVLTTAVTDPSVCLWDVATGQELFTLVHPRRVYVANWSPDGQWVVTASEDFKAHVWNAHSGQELHTLAHKGDVFFAVFSPQGDKVATASHDRTARIWDVRTGQPFSPPLPHGAAVRTIQFTPDGRGVVTASADRTAQVWEVSSGRKVGEPGRHHHEVAWAEFDPSGTRFVTASDDTTARVWDARTGQPVTEPLPHFGRVLTAHFSRDGASVLTASDDGTARLWDARTGQPLAEPMRHSSRINTARFSPDGRWMVTASDDHTAKLWEIPEMPQPIPVWLPEAAEAVAGWRRNAQGTLEYVPVDSRFALRRRLEISVGTNSSEGRWLGWFLADRDTRRISPAHSLRVSHYVRARLDENTLDSLYEAARLSPANGLVLARLARKLLAPDPTVNSRAAAEADLYSRRALELAPEEEEAWSVREEVLTSAGNTAAALEKLESECVRQPHSARLWNLKGRLLEKTARLEDAYQAYNQALSWINSSNAPSVRLRHKVLLDRVRVLRRLHRFPEAAADNLQALAIPPREASAPPNVIDLSAYYNAATHESWQAPGSNHGLNALPTGLSALGGVPFDLRGIVQLSGREARKYGHSYPESVTDIQVGQHCRRLRFLHATGWIEQDGTAVGTYRIHYTDGHQEQWPIVYGTNLQDWWVTSDAVGKASHATVAWQGKTPGGQEVRLYADHWENPRPETQVKSIDFVSTMSRSAPFLIAITAE